MATVYRNLWTEIDNLRAQLAQATARAEAYQRAALEHHAWCQAANAKLAAAEAREATLIRLVTELQAHAKECGWQDVDEPIASLLEWRKEEA